MKDLSDTSYMLLVYLLLFIVWFCMLGQPVHAETIQQQIVASAERHGIDPQLALAIAEVESQFNADAIGGLGEIGVFQLRPEFHPVVKGQTRKNIEVAMRYLAELQRQCGRYGDAYFVCFNYGSARPLKHPRLFPYYVKVKAVQNRRANHLASAD